MSDIVFGLKLTADGSGFVGTVSLAKNQIEQLGLASEKTARQVDGTAQAMKRGQASAMALGTAIGQFAVEAVKGLARWAAAGIEAADSLKDLSDETGSTVESLSHLVNVAKIGGTSTDLLRQGLERLSVGLSGTDEESVKAGKALARLGIQARDPATALGEVAKKFAQYKDDANKAAWAQEIFGRGGQKLLPMLKDLAEQEGNVGTVTRQQALEAERLSESWRKLSVDLGELRDGILTKLVPALADLIAQFRGGIEIAGGFWRAVNLFSTLPTVANVVDAEAVIAKVTANLEDSGKKYETSFGKWVNALLGNSLDKANADAKAKIDFLRLQIAQLRKTAALQDPEFGDLAGAMAKWGPGGTATSTSLGAVPGGSGKGKKEVDEYAKALERVTQLAAEARAELEGVFNPDSLSKGNKELVKLANSDTWKKFTDAQKETLKIRLAEATALEKEKKQWEDLEKAAAAYAAQRADERRDYDEALKKNKDEVDDLVRTLGLETQTMFQTNEERERAVALSRIMFTSEQEYEEQVKRVNEAFDQRNSAAALKKSLDAAKDAAREWQKRADDIANSLTDALLRGFESGKDFAKNFFDTLKNMAATLVLRPIIQFIVSPLSGAITAELGGLGSIFGIGGSGMQIGTALGNLGTIIPTLMQTGSVQTAFAGMASSFAAVAPWAALAAVAVPLVMKWFDQGDAMRTGTFVSGAATAATGLTSPNRGSSAFGDFSVINGKWFSDADMGESMRQFMAGIKGIDDAIAAFVGADKTAEITAMLEGISTQFNAGMEHQAVEFGSILKDRYTAVAHVIDPALEEIVRAFEGTGEELAKVVVNFLAQQEAMKQVAAQSLQSLQQIKMQLSGMSSTQIGAVNQMALIKQFASTRSWASDYLAQVGQTQFVRNLQAIGEEDFGRYSTDDQKLILAILDAQVSLNSAQDAGVSTLNNYTSAQTGANDALADAARAAEQMQQALRGIGEYVNSLLLGDLSPLTPMQRFAEAQSQYQQTLGLAQGGDLQALNSLSSSANVYLQLARDAYASSQQYTDIFRDVVGSLSGVAGGGHALANFQGAQDSSALLARVLPTTGSTLASKADIEAMADKFVAAIVALANANSSDSDALAGTVKTTTLQVVQAITSGGGWTK